MGSRRCDGMMPARRMAEQIMFIMSQSRPCTSQIWICEITSYVTTYDCSVIKITRTDTTSAKANIKQAKIQPPGPQVHLEA